MVHYRLEPEQVQQAREALQSRLTNYWVINQKDLQATTLAIQPLTKGLKIQSDDDWNKWDNICGLRIFFASLLRKAGPRIIKLCMSLGLSKNMKKK